MAKIVPVQTKMSKEELNAPELHLEDLPPEEQEAVLKRQEALDEAKNERDAEQAEKDKIKADLEIEGAQFVADAKAQIQKDLYPLAQSILSGEYIGEDTTVKYPEEVNFYLKTEMGEVEVFELKRLTVKTKSVSHKIREVVR